MERAAPGGDVIEAGAIGAFGEQQREQDRNGRDHGARDGRSR